MKTIIHWFRRDLRVTDNTALAAAVRDGDLVCPVYVVSDWEGEHRWTGANRQAFLCGCLESLNGNIRELGGRLVFRRGDAVEEIARLTAETGAHAIYFSRDPDPFGRAAEERLGREMRQRGVEVRGFKDVTIHERDEVLTGAGEPFRVFTPYSRAWAKLPKPELSPRPRAIRSPDGIVSDSCPSLGTWKLGPAAPGIVEAGERAARKRLKIFAEGALARYGDGRDLPGENFTSRLSQDLRWGLLSPREVHAVCRRTADELPASSRSQVEKFIAELVWREFYMQVLWHFPEVLETEFNPKFAGLAWPGREEDYERWCAAETGFPIVDAAMRELRETGYVHNRARMITAMFLTKDLLVDWRRGEQWFIQHLVDGEIASNNGGWQWSAGTGADAAPYFRIQNPWTQTRRHDPEGRYVKRWLPELRDLPAEAFFEPPAPGLRLAKGYPSPMVDHAAARDRALEFFGEAKERS